jgi:outer membrane protein assembly factor BamB
VTNDLPCAARYVTFGGTRLEIVKNLTLACVAGLSLFVGLLPAIEARPVTAAGVGYDWLQFGGDAQHSSNDTAESAISAATVSTLHKSYTATLPAVADGAPVYLSSVSTVNGTQDLVYVTTKDGRILALDAHTGVTVWSHQYGPGTCAINLGSNPCYTTSSPAIDPNRQYVYSYGLDGRVHKYASGTGVESTASGWPELVTTKGYNEKESPALGTATVSGTSYLYVGNGGYPGDNGDYQGHLTAINLSTGSQHVFNTLCSNQTDVHFVETPGSPDCAQVQSAVWARPGAVYDAATNRIYLGTGNGSYAPGSYDWGDSILALNPDGTGVAGGNPLDSYTPTNYASLQSSDADLGSTAPAILPAPAGSSVQHLAVQGGKDAKLRLLNLDNLSGQGGPGHTGGEIGTPISVPQGGQVLTQPAVWVNPADNSTWVFVGTGNGISGLKLGLSGTTPVLQSMWQKTGGGSSPLIANGVLFFAGSNRIQALDPTTGAQLWQDTTIGGIHWESPVVANGMLYITDESGKLNAYALPVSTTAASVTSAASTQQYTLTGSDGATWQSMDTTNLQQSITPTSNVNAIIGGNADLWTSSTGYNQDLGIWISGGSYGTGQVVAWKESGGFAGTYSPNAAYVHTVLPLSASTTYTVKLVWKSNKSDPGTIWAGAGAGSPFSPTRLTAELIPTGSSTTVSSAVSTQQYTLTGSDGSTWTPIDSTNVSTSVTPSSSSTMLLSGNSDLWTSSAGYNQDIGLWISGGVYGTGQVVAWKESGGFAGTFSPNAAYVQTVLPLAASTTYTARLVWKTNKADSGTIWAGAGPISSAFSPTRLTAEVIPSTSSTSVASTVSTQQYTLATSDGTTWQSMDTTKLQQSITPTSNVNAILSGNSDLWTSSAGYNQDLGLWISGGVYGTGQVVAWKESGGFAGTFSPNVAYVHTVLPLVASTTYTVKLVWKTNKADPGTIWAGAGPISTAFSPTRLTAELVPG